MPQLPRRPSELGQNTAIREVHHRRGKSAAIPSLIVALLLAGCIPASAQNDLPRSPSLERFVAACEGKTGWDDPAPPIRVFANVYHVGTCGITALLVVSDDGHVLLDSGTEKAAPQVAANIAALGIKLSEVKWIVTTHEHHDHVGGVAELKRLTGARLAARAAARRPLETGMPDWRDPQATPEQGLPDFPGAPVDRIMRNGEHLVLGTLDFKLHATPGHSPGSTTWSWRACEGTVCRTVVYADSVTAISAEGFRFSGVPLYVAAFRRSLATIAGLECDILITPHPAAAAFHERLAGEQPLVDAQGCRRYAEAGLQRLEARLAEEQG